METKDFFSIPMLLHQAIRNMFTLTVLGSTLVVRISVMEYAEMLPAWVIVINSYSPEPLVYKPRDHAIGFFNLKSLSMS